MPLRLLLNRAGIFKPGPGARFVCMAGPEQELPRSYDGQDGRAWAAPPQLSAIKQFRALLEMRVRGVVPRLKIWAAP